MSSDILLSIINGECDNDLEQIKAAVKGREQALQSITIGFLRPGDEVKFSDKIRPKYLVGKTATVVSINDKSVTVTCPADPSYGRFNGLKKVRCPKSLIEGLA